MWSRRRKKKKLASFGEDTSAALQLVLTTVRESSDAFPPLKGAVGGLLKVLELIEVCHVPVVWGMHRLTQFTIRKQKQTKKMRRDLDGDDH